MEMMTNPTYVFQLSGPIKPKARPRCACRGRNPVVYTDSDYARWKTSAANEGSTPGEAIANLQQAIAAVFTKTERVEHE
jgi:hypothetical protein